MTSEIIVKDYGDMIAKLKDMELIHFEEFGSFDGLYLAVLFDEETKRIFIYSWEYGSCSGCDWLEAEWRGDSGVNYRIGYQIANDYVAQMRPTLILLPTIYCKSYFFGIMRNSPVFNFWEKDAEQLASVINECVIKKKLDEKTDSSLD